MTAQDSLRSGTGYTFYDRTFNCKISAAYPSALEEKTDIEHDFIKSFSYLILITAFLLFLGEGLPIHLIDYLTLGGGAMLAIYCANLAHPKISKYAAVKKGTIPTLIIAFFLSDMLRESSNSTIEVMPFMFGTSWALYMGFANIISLYRELLKTLVSSIK